MIANAGTSLWHATLPDEERAPRPPLAGDLDVDVAIVGAGYTGLWTAYALMRADPTLRIVICEAEVAGFGASGRNGGWCSSFFAGSRDATEHRAGREGVDRDATRQCLRPSTRSSRSSRPKQIDCDWARGGTIDVATRPAHIVRLQRELDAAPCRTASARTTTAGSSRTSRVR